MEQKTTVLFVLLFSLASFLSLPVPTTASPPVSAVFAFGDSTVDSGNNNRLPFTLFRSDHPPYGRDLPNHVPSGRFTNGKLSTDFMVSILGLKDLLPAYRDPRLTDRELLTGVSFASGGSGLDDLTLAVSKATSLGRQLEEFDEALGRMRRTVGEKNCSEIVNNAVFVISVGTNDMVFNLFDLPVTARKIEFSPSGYQDFLLRGLGSFIQNLYQRGARRFQVAGLPPIGCLPMQLTIGSVFNGLRRVCVEQQNTDCQAYNTKLQGLIPSLQASLPGSRLAYFDSYNPILDMFNNPSKYGFVQTHEGCCGTGMVELGPLCGQLSLTCPDPSKFLFWDSMHPSQAAYKVLADISARTVLPHLTA
ncbi:GDSL esterase/lipase At2g40250-like [Pyrus x bretschneideri]|uniref:GDSL esterase/lipase At2g40250-like n=1 Tax=Pyrus x bretschneideri TaxID=225117 RepID=UPI00202FC664|nr:GDSL esterase/lipase At2g40250-like [Pyrus x bretschneideri]